jgi:hypothetical protein
VTSRERFAGNKTDGRQAARAVHKGRVPRQLFCTPLGQKDQVEAKRNSVWVMSVCSAAPRLWTSTSFNSAPPNAPNDGLSLPLCGCRATLPQITGWRRRTSEQKLRLRDARETNTERGATQPSGRLELSYSSFLTGQEEMSSAGLTDSGTSILV